MKLRLICVGKLAEAWTWLASRPEKALFADLQQELDHLAPETSELPEGLAERFLKVLNNIQPEEPPKAAKPAGISEHSLKQHLMFLMLGLKVVVIGWLYTQFESGGYAKNEFLGLMGVMVPVFTTYTGVMFKEFVDRRHGHQDSGLHVSRTFQLTSYFVLLGYGLICILILGLKPQGKWDYAQISTWLTLLEAGLGVYVGRLIFSLFGHPEK